LIDEDNEVDSGDGEEAVRKEAVDLKDRENSGECSRDEVERYIVFNPDTKASCTSSRFLSSSLHVIQGSDIVLIDEYSSLTNFSSTLDENKNRPTNPNLHPVYCQSRRRLATADSFKVDVMGALLSIPFLAVPGITGVGGWILSCCGAAAVS